MTRSEAGFFVVIEGLDGSGKTEVARQVTRLLRNVLTDRMLHTFEPYDPLCAGLFIRQVLGKRITTSPRTLALAFAANRADHNQREIAPFLEKGGQRLVLCDRYYLSSLVYQTPAFSFDEIMLINAEARQPDLTIFLDASADICYRRMSNRPADRELFETNLAETRSKYEQAIAFLRARGETVVEVNADADLMTVVNAVLAVIQAHGPDWLTLETQAGAAPAEVQQFQFVGDLKAARKARIDEVVVEVQAAWAEQAGADLPDQKRDFSGWLRRLKVLVVEHVEALSLDDLGLLFLGYLERLGYNVRDPLPWPDLPAFEVTFAMPLGVQQRGTALLLADQQHYDEALKRSEAIGPLSDFMFIFDPSRPRQSGVPYEREAVQHSSNGASLSPSTRILTRDHITRFVLADVVGQMAFPES